jgi:hypothetical protein
MYIYIYIYIYISLLESSVTCIAAYLAGAASRGARADKVLEPSRPPAARERAVRTHGVRLWMWMWIFIYCIYIYIYIYACVYIYIVLYIYIYI